MSKLKKINVLKSGFAIFSMFFGSGNVIFPLIVGKESGSHIAIALFGLLLTAVIVPFLGLFAMVNFDGNYFNFFKRLGKYPAWFLLIVIMGLIGPFGAIPRCVAISYSTFSTFIPSLSVVVFSVVSCILIFLCSYKRSYVVDVLGKYLTPLLLGVLSIVIIVGILTFLQFKFVEKRVHY